MNHADLKFLLVEQDDIDANLAELMIRNSPVKHIEITRVIRLSEAVEHLSQNKMDLVILEPNLPDTNGLESIEALRKAAPEVPILVLTTNSDATMGVQAFEKGAAGYLVKGQIGPWMFANTVKRALIGQYC